MLNFSMFPRRSSPISLDDRTTVSVLAFLQCDRSQYFVKLAVNRGLFSWSSKMSNADASA